MNIIMFGPPGSGKGTQSDIIANAGGYFHLSTGVLLREEIAKQSVLGKEVEKTIEQGKLVADDLILKIIDQEVKWDKECGIIFDGFPRTVEQAQGLASLLLRHGKQIDVVVDLHVPHDAIIERIRDRAKSEHRADDTDSAVESRLDEYHLKTLPVLDYYFQSDTPVISVDGMGTVDIVAKRVSDGLDSLQQQGSVSA